MFVDSPELEVIIICNLTDQSGPGVDVMKSAQMSIWPLACRLPPPCTVRSKQKALFWIMVPVTRDRWGIRSVRLPYRLMTGKPFKVGDGPRSNLHERQA
jgi:hypothetical protein